MNQSISGSLCQLEMSSDTAVLRLFSEDGTNRLTRSRVLALTKSVEELAARPPKRLVITGNTQFFSAGADLHEIAELYGAAAFRFAQMG